MGQFVYLEDTGILCQTLAARKELECGIIDSIRVPSPGALFPVQEGNMGEEDTYE